MRASEFFLESSKDTIHNRPKLDTILVELCELIIKGQKHNSEKYGMVAACVLDPKNRKVLRLNESNDDGTRRHAERVAIDSYVEKYGDIPDGSIIITTLSPCNEDDTTMADERYGSSCTDLINNNNVRKVYCGYMDPSQHNDHEKYTLEETDNSNIKKLCKKFADTFLDSKDEITEEAKAAKYNGLIMKYAFNDNALLLKAFDPTKTPIAYVKFIKEGKELYPQDLWVHDDYRNRGIAKSMYDFLKNEGYVINRSHDQTKAGSGFWDKHRGEDAYVWEEINPDIRNPEFEHEQQIGKYKYTAHTDMSGSGLTTYLMIRCYDGSKLIGQVNFEVRVLAGKKWLESQKTQVEGGYTNKGIASTMYAYAKMLGNDIKPSAYQSDDGKAMWKAWKKSGDAKHLTTEEIIDEMPLPADWDPQQMRQQGTSFKSRLAYALERAKKLGTGSSRVATIIEYEGRPTVLKIAKNAKGLAQNSVEADILSDGYASQLGILIPIIDYDEQNREPSWVHTEMATKASEKQLCNVMKCDNLSQLVNMAWAITGKKKYVGNYDGYVKHLQEKGKSEQDIETMTDYANTLADLNSNFDVELGDFARAANWGFYKGKPVIIDVGFNSNVLSQYYSR